HAVRDVDEPEYIRLEHRSHHVNVERTDLPAVRIASVVDQHVDSTHVLLACVDGSRIVVATGNVCPYSVSARLLRNVRDQLLVATCEHDAMAGLAGGFNNRRADALRSAGDEKAA